MPPDQRDTKTVYALKIHEGRSSSNLYSSYENIDDDSIKRDVTETKAPVLFVLLGLNVKSKYIDAIIVIIFQLKINNYQHFQTS